MRLRGGVCLLVLLFRKVKQVDRDERSEELANGDLILHHYNAPNPLSVNLPEAIQELNRLKLVSQRLLLSLAGSEHGYGH